MPAVALSRPPPPLLPLLLLLRLLEGLVLPLPSAGLLGLEPPLPLPLGLAGAGSVNSSISGDTPSPDRLWRERERERESDGKSEGKREGKREGNRRKGDGQGVH